MISEYRWGWVLSKGTYRLQKQLHETPAKIPQDKNMTRPACYITDTYIVEIKSGIYSKNGESEFTYYMLN